MIDIVLLLNRYPSDPGHAEFLEWVRDLVSRLAGPDTPFSRLVRRAVCLDTDLSTPDRADFAIRFIVPTAVTRPSG